MMGCHGAAAPSAQAINTLNTPIIEAVHLVKAYPVPGGGSLRAVDDVSFVIEATEVYGILGPNGAGKTTTLEMLEGLKDIDSGHARVDGIDVGQDPWAVKSIIGVQLQAGEYFENLNLTELLDLFAGLYVPRVARPDDLLALVDLSDKYRAKSDELSGGQLQRFSIACALVNEPRVLFLDEPTTGLDPQAKHNLWDLIRSLNEQGMTIVLTTHNMEEAETLCNRIAIMDHGKIVAEDTPQALIAQHAPEPPAAPTQGNIEDVFLALTGHGLRD